MKNFLLRFGVALIISVALYAPKWILVAVSLLSIPFASLLVLLPWMGLQFVLIFVLPDRTHRAWEGFCFRVSYRVQERLGIYLPLYLIGLVCVLIVDRDFISILENVWPN